MRAAAIAATAKLLGVTIKGPDGRGWFTLTCPFGPWKHKSGRDRSPNMGVQVNDHGFSRWRCLSCGEGGTLSEVVLTLRLFGAELPFAELLALAAGEEDEITFQPFEIHEPTPVLILPETYLDGMLPSWESPAAAQYLADRKIPIERQAAWDMRYDAARRRVFFPIRDFEGHLRGGQGRTILPDVKPKYKHYAYPNVDAHGDTPGGTVYGHHFWLGEHRVDFDKPIVLVEGPLDAERVSETYENVVAACGGSAVLTHDKLDRLALCSTVVTFFDADEAGDATRERIQGWCLRKRICRHVRPEGAKDPGAMHAQNIAMLLAPHLDVADLKL